MTTAYDVIVIGAGQSDSSCHVGGDASVGARLGGEGGLLGDQLRVEWGSAESGAGLAGGGDAGVDSLGDELAFGVSTI